MWNCLPIFEGALIASVTYTFVSFGQTAELNSAQLFKKKLTGLFAQQLCKTSNLRSAHVRCDDLTIALFKFGWTEV